MDGADFIYLMPLELWTKIFTYLPRRDRFVCMCLCPRWREALDVPSLWKHMCVRLDVDFFDISTIQLAMEFCKYVKSLELKFQHSEEPLQWINYKMIDITKRTYRFLSVFLNKNLQIYELSFSNFCVFYKTKKILYYLTVFLRSQTKIREISFNNSNFSKKAFLKLLTSSLTSNSRSIEYLDMQNSYYEGDLRSSVSQFNVLSSQLIICITSIEHLIILRIDLESMINNNVLNGILNSACQSLECLDIRIAEHDLLRVSHAKLYSNTTWLNLKKKLPSLKVSVIFYNIVYQYRCIDSILSRSIPMFCITWISDATLFKEVVHISFKKYPESLEVIKLSAKDDTLNELLMIAMQECPNLKMVELTGIIYNIVQMQESLHRMNFIGFQNYDFYIRSNKQSGNVKFSNERVYRKLRNNIFYVNFKFLN